MMDLERQLGVQLLVRGKKQVTLTDEGTYLRARAQEMIDLMERTEAALRSEEGTLGGDVYLGCGETRVMEFVADVFARLRADFPEMRLHLHSGDAEEVMKRLDEGLWTSGFCLGPLHRDKYDYLDLGMRDTYGLLMPADCPLAERGSVTLDDLKQVPLIFPTNPTAGTSASTGSAPTSARFISWPPTTSLRRDVSCRARTGLRVLHRRPCGCAKRARPCVPPGRAGPHAGRVHRCETPPHPLPCCQAVFERLRKEVGR